METYLTIEKVVAYLKLAVQTIRRYVLHRDIPFHEIKKVVRFQLSEIEWRVVNGGMPPLDYAKKLILPNLKNYRKLLFFLAPLGWIFELCGCGKPAVYIF